MSWTALIGDLGVVAAVVGVLVVILQLRQGAQQARVEFEDSLNREYRAIISELGAEVMYVDARLTTPELEERFTAFYRYFDLCNEQIYLWQKLRISGDTWGEWKDAFVDTWSCQRSPRRGSSSFPR